MPQQTLDTTGNYGQRIIYQNSSQGISKGSNKNIYEKMAILF